MIAVDYWFFYCLPDAVPGWAIIAHPNPNDFFSGQALASRPDLLPSEYLEELQELQDNVPTFSNEIAFRIVEEELNQKFGDVFELVEPEPIAGKFQRYSVQMLEIYSAYLMPNCCICFPSRKHRPSLQSYPKKKWTDNCTQNPAPQHGRDCRVGLVRSSLVGRLLQWDI